MTTFYFPSQNKGERRKVVMLMLVLVPQTRTNHKNSGMFGGEIFRTTENRFACQKLLN